MNQTGTTFHGIQRKVETEGDIDALVADVDLVINPFSYVPVEDSFTHVAGIVAKACIRRGTAMLSLGGNMVGPLYTAHDGICYFCVCKNLESMIGIDVRDRNPMIQKRVFAPTVSALCSMAVWEATAYLSGFTKPRVLDKILRIDWSQGYNDARTTTLERVEGCGFCGARTHRRHL